MYLSYTSARSLYDLWTKGGSDATNLTNGDTYINLSLDTILGNRAWPFLEVSRPLTTVAQQQFYTLPYDVEKVSSVYITIGSTKYYPKECPSFDNWNKLNETTFYADFPQWYFVFNGQVGFWPITSTSSNTITVIGKKTNRRLNIADYTTGNIVSIANGGTAVVGSGTSWTSQMVGRFIRFTMADTANTGDDLWYEIAAVPSATTITLTRSYGGTSISAGSCAYTIGQMSNLPEKYQQLPVTRAALLYWAVQKDTERVGYFKGLYDEEMAQFVNDYGSKSTNVVVDDGVSDYQQPNPNLFVTL